jgi:hypothetical protein
MPGKVGDKKESSSRVARGSEDAELKIGHSQSLIYNQSCLLRIEMINMSARQDPRLMRDRIGAGLRQGGQLCPVHIAKARTHHSQLIEAQLLEAILPVRGNPGLGDKAKIAE